MFFDSSIQKRKGAKMEMGEMLYKCKEFTSAHLTGKIISFKRKSECQTEESFVALKVVKRGEGNHVEFHFYDLSGAHLSASCNHLYQYGTDDDYEEVTDVYISD